MIGNDIVTFTKQRSKERQRKYQDRILTKEEQLLFKNFDNKVKIGLAWSIKEAIYKYFARAQDLLFIPKNWNIVELFSVSSTKNVNDFNGKFVKQGFENLSHFATRIQSSNRQIFGKTLIFENFIYTVVTDERSKLDKIYWGVLEIDSVLYRDQSKAVRCFAKEQFSNIFSVANIQTLQFRSDEKSVPNLYLNNIQLNCFFSFSHHTHFVAYAWI